MNEADWLACTHTKAVLEVVRGTATDRQFRLLIVSCCRRVWNFLTDERSRTAVEVGERFADGQATDDERQKAHLAAIEVRSLAGITAKYAVSGLARPGVMMVVDVAGQTAACPPGEEYDPSKWEAESRVQSDLIRDIFGNPFRPAKLDVSRLTPVVIKLAQAMYDERDFDRMLQLADALEQRGCSDEMILNHCRAPGPHVRGCWVVDLVLGKK